MLGLMISNSNTNAIIQNLKPEFGLRAQTERYLKKLNLYGLQSFNPKESAIGQIDQNCSWFFCKYSLQYSSSML